MAVLRITFVFGTHPQGIKLFPLINVLLAAERFGVRVCVSAQHRSMLDQVLDVARNTPGHDLDVGQQGEALDALNSHALTAESTGPAMAVLTGNAVFGAILWINGRIYEASALASTVTSLSEQFAGNRIPGVTSHRRESFGGGMEASAFPIHRMATRLELCAALFGALPQTRSRTVVKRGLRRPRRVNATRSAAARPRR